MTADEKTSIARFLDTALAALGSGYRLGEPEYRLSDDPERETAAPAGNAAGTAPARAAASDNAAVTAPGAAPSTDPDSLEQIAAEVRSCTACSLCETRTNAAPGEGADHPLVLVIGEGPGADEDATGRPFVGRAGQLLDKMLAAIGLSRERNCFIANVVKCRPPNNRDPLPEETAACAPFLERQIRLLKPGMILCAGRVAAHTLLRTGESLGALRGRFFSLDSAGAAIPLLVSYHPSALLRNEELKRPAWEDLKMLKGAIMPAAADTAVNTGADTVGESGAGRDG